MSIRKAATKFNIPKSVLGRHKKSNIKQRGGQTVLTAATEKILVKRLLLCAEWGYPMDSLDLRMIVKGYMDRQGLRLNKFKNNLPGPDFFLV